MTATIEVPALPDDVASRDVRGRALDLSEHCSAIADELAKLAHGYRYDHEALIAYAAEVWSVAYQAAPAGLDLDEPPMPATHLALGYQHAPHTTQSGIDEARRMIREALR